MEQYRFKKQSKVETDQELNRKHAAPTELWVGLILLTIVTIVLIILLTHDGRKNQRRMEKKIAYIKTSLYGKEKI